MLKPTGMCTERLQERFELLPFCLQTVQVIFWWVCIIVFYMAVLWNLFQQGLAQSRCRNWVRGSGQFPEASLLLGAPSGAVSTTCGDFTSVTPTKNGYTHHYSTWHPTNKSVSRQMHYTVVFSETLVFLHLSHCLPKYFLQILCLCIFNYTRLRKYLSIHI